MSSEHQHNHEHNHGHPDVWTYAAYVGELSKGLAAIFVVAEILDPFFRSSGGNLFNVPVPNFEYDISPYVIAAVLCVSLGILSAAAHRCMNLHCQKSKHPEIKLHQDQKAALVGDFVMQTLENAAVPALLITIFASSHLDNWEFILLQLLSLAYGAVTAWGTVRSHRENILRYNKEQEEAEKTGQKQPDLSTQAAYGGKLLNGFVAIFVVAGILDPLFKSSGMEWLNVPITNFEYDISPYIVASISCVVFGILAAKANQYVNLYNQKNDTQGQLTTAQKWQLRGDWFMHSLENSATLGLLISIVAGSYFQDSGLGFVLSGIQLVLLATYGRETAKADVRSCQHNMLEKPAP